MKKLITLIRKQKGAVMVYLAIGIVPLVAALGLVIDYGSAVSCSNKMQKAVDAAALGGASFLPESNAQLIAEELAETNYGEYDDYDVIVTGDQINVTMERSVPTKFMRIFGQNTMDVSVSATATAPQPVGQTNEDMMPFCLINPNTNNVPDDDLVPSNWGQPYILFYGEDNIIVEDWAYDGSLYNGAWEGIPENPNIGNASPSAGWRGALDLHEDGTIDGAGANSFRTNIGDGWPGTAGINDVLPVETGNMANPTVQGRDDRIIGEEDELLENFDPRIDYDMGRVVLVPIVSLLQSGSTTERYTIDDYEAGLPWELRDVIIDGFAPFWVLSQDEQGNVDGDNNKNNDGDWIIGIFIPGTRIPGSNGGGIDFGSATPPRLID